MDIRIIDIWLNKIKKFGWKLEDIPNKEIREEVEKRLKDNDN